MSSSSIFHTRKLANEGIELPLFTPTGEKTEHRIWIRGTDSDAFRIAVAKQRRALVEIAAEKGIEAIDTEDDELKLDLVASLVIRWTLSEDCTPENVKEFLREAPQIRASIDALASRRSLFFKRVSKDSTSTPEPSLNSPSPSKDQPVA